jgi:MinD superfamily P-loop ATPase
MIIAVASGKGGTGKTTVSVSLALSLENDLALLDCDVEEPNAAIFLPLGAVNPPASSPITVPIPNIDENLCNACGDCADFCEFNAIVHIGTSVLVFPELCHSCGGCTLLCPQRAITEIPMEIGTLSTSTFQNKHFAQGLLSIGKAMSPPVIRAVKDSIKGKTTDGIVIIDCPPGTSCPMTTAVTGSEYVLLVTEPTPFGLHDLNLAVQTVRMMGIPFGVVINRCDSGDDRVLRYCEKEKISVVLQIPEDRRIAKGYSMGIPLIESALEYKQIFQDLLKHLVAEYGGRS